MKVVIFGSAGQLGRELARAHWPTGLEILCPPEAHADVTQEEAVARLLQVPKVGVAINAAAYTAVDKAENEPEAAFRVNRDGAGNLARACASRGVPLVHVSTDYVFDGAKGEPYLEDDAINPLNVYGHSKAAGESAIRELLPEHIILRTSWLFSAFGQNFVKTILRLAMERDRLRVVADQFGRPTPTADLAAALTAIVAKHARGEPVPWGTYHFAGVGRASWYDLAQRTVDLQAAHTGRLPSVEAINSADYPTLAARPIHSELDTRGFERAFARSPRPWEEGLAEVIHELFNTRSKAQF
jgi:dTDP-4-dehydrorhamnose reductase